MSIALDLPKGLTPVPGFPGYFATPDGEVYSRVPIGRPKNGTQYDRTSGSLKRLVGCKHSFGYRLVSLVLNGKRHMRTVHAVILETFTGPKPDGQECRHLDGNPANNRIDNLAWGTPLENAKDKAKHGTQERGESHHHAKLTEIVVQQIRSLMRDGHRQKDIAKRFGVTNAAISAISTGRLWSHVS